MEGILEDLRATIILDNCGPDTDMSQRMSWKGVKSIDNPTRRSSPWSISYRAMCGYNGRAGASGKRR
ncbi:hypothetical protein B296_00036279 [Ensete ventricosum]|uniref:Uncharacterized protein n=1 Tax=Ensete ventricosum TaxID=4639 RepID=A0A426XH70_ENSVE|nr:hypothetical protein B296_00036279 [Ensete ventricosum]